MPRDPLIGTIIASHRIEAVIGEGGFSTVYRARHVRLPRTRALKLLTVSLAHDPSFRERFERESRIAAELDHPNIVEVIDAGDENGRLYIVMRYVKGDDLAAALTRDGPLSAHRAIEIITGIADALDAAHERGLVHRDVKPQNILLSDDGGIYLTDFGIAKAAASRGLTITGMFVGTPDYAAPEQFEADPLDGRTDQYALAGVLYTALTGAVPYEKTSDAQVMTAHMTEPPPRPSTRRPDLPAELDDVIVKAMAKRKEERFPSCEALVAAARAIADGPRFGLASRTRPVVAPAVPSNGADVATIAAPVPGAASRQRSDTPVDAPAAVRPWWGRRWVLGAAAAGLLLVVAAIAAFLATRGDGPSGLTFDAASARATWNASKLVSGRVRVSGSVEHASKLRATLRSSGSGLVLAERRFAVGPGAFTRSLALPPATKPGQYRLRIGGASSGSTLPAVERGVVVPAPPEGFVDRAAISDAFNGLAVRVLFHPKHLYARFHFLTAPRHTTVALTWQAPTQLYVAHVRKPYAVNVNTFVTGSITPGTWSCILRVGGQVVKQVSVRVK